MCSRFTASSNHSWIPDDEEPQVIVPKRVSRKQVPFDGIDLPVYLIKEAISVHRELSIETHRGNRQKQVHLACLHIAGLRLGLPQAPARLAKALGMEQRNITGAAGYVNIARARGQEKSVAIVTPAAMANSYLRELEKEEKFSEKCASRWNEVKSDEKFKELPVYIGAAWLLIDRKAGTKAEILTYFGIDESKLPKIK